MPEQPQADRTGPAQLRIGAGRVSAGLHHAGHQGRRLGVRHRLWRRQSQRSLGLWLGALLLPFIEQANLQLAFDMNLPCWAPRNATAARTKLPVFLCPSATGGSDGFAVEYDSGDFVHGVNFSPEIFFAHSHYVTNAGVHQPWGRTEPYSYDFELPEPIASQRQQTGDARRPVLSQLENYRGTRHRWIIEHDLHRRAHFVLSNKTWVGVVPRAVTCPRLDLLPWPSECNTGGCLVGAHSGPDTHDHPQIIIHAPNNPFGHTDQMHSEHVGGAQRHVWRRFG